MTSRSRLMFCGIIIVNLARSQIISGTEECLPFFHALHSNQEEVALTIVPRKGYFLAYMQEGLLRPWSRLV